MKPNHLLRSLSLLSAVICVMTNPALAAPIEAFEAIIFDENETSFIEPYESNYGSIRNNVEFHTYNGGLLLHAGQNASAATSSDGGISLWGNPIRILLEGTGGNAHAASFEVSRGNAWQSFPATPIFKIDALTLNSTFTGSNVAINGGSLSVGAGLTVTGNQTVSGTLSAGGSPVITAASAGSVLTGQNFVQLGSGGVLNITSTTLSTSSTTGAITVAGGIGVAKDASINSLTVGRGPGNALSNTVFGRNAFEANAGGFGNTAVGNFAMKSATAALYNTAFGSNALQLTVTGGSNVAVGSSALYANTGSGNVATGYNALAFKTSGFSNIAVGHRAGEQQSDNSNLVTSSDSIFIGAGTKGSTAGSNNSIVIGTSTVSDGPNTTVIGNTSTLSTRLEGETKSESLRVSGNTVLEGDTVIEGSVTLAEAQGDISMGDYQ